MEKEETMLNRTDFKLPPTFNDIEAATEAAGWTRISGPSTGSLLRTLAAAKAGGSLLELGTGTGIGTAWILDGMDEKSHLVTVDANESRPAIARRYLGHDARVTFKAVDAATFILSSPAASFDFIFADTPPGKYQLLAETLRLLKPGGVYIVDHLLPEPDWEEDRPAKVQNLITTLEQRPDLHVTTMDWSTGLLIAVKR
jgi:predicted O-methyltransferase YrrM